MEDVMGPEELKQLLTEIQAAEERLGGLQDSVLRLAELKSSVAELASLTENGQQRAHFFDRRMTAIVDRILDFERDSTFLAKAAQHEQLAATLSNGVRAARELEGKMTALVALEQRAKVVDLTALRLEEFAARLEASEKAAGLRARSLEVLERSCAQRERELSVRIEAAEKIVSAVDKLGTATHQLVDLERRIAALQEKEGDLEKALVRRQTAIAGGRERGI